ncbi:hypothetical protein V6N12_032972 [Hibiscus sabdariffa]|uniref:Uncharacterized protein n=1 Tax=Hibiscus sabdariffa TaxID=183260 RepID=A0ABR2AKN5_9ROSI
MNKKEEISGCFNGPEVREDVESVENFLKAWKRSKRQTPKILERTKYLGTSVAESVHPPSEASKVHVIGYVCFFHSSMVIC